MYGGIYTTITCMMQRIRLKTDGASCALIAGDTSCVKNFEVLEPWHDNLLNKREIVTVQRSMAVWRGVQPAWPWDGAVSENVAIP